MSSPGNKKLRFALKEGVPSKLVLDRLTKLQCVVCGGPASSDNTCPMCDAPTKP